MMVREPRHFLVAATPRTGSDLVCGLLNQMDGLACFCEVLHPDPVQRRVHPAADGAIWDGRDAVAFLQRAVFLQHGHRSGPRAGFKFIHAIDNWRTRLGPLTQLLGQDVTHVIKVRRRNRLDQWVSLQLALRRDLFRATPDQAVEKTAIKLHPTFFDLLLFFRWEEQFWIDLSEDLVGTSVKVVEIVYEDFVRDMRLSIEQLAHAMGVRDEIIIVTRQKLNHRAPSEVIENYAELKEWFADTEYGEFFL